MPRDLLKLSMYESIVDAGAFVGDTALLFAKKTEYQYKRIISFEPSEFHYQLLKYNTKNLKNIDYYQYGLYDTSKKIGFSSECCIGSMILTENETVKIDTVAIDSFLYDKINITFIKMDIEGAELKALEGAKETIHRDRPKLAICIYHKIDDL